MGFISGPLSFGNSEKDGDERGQERIGSKGWSGHAMRFRLSTVRKNRRMNVRLQSNRRSRIRRRSGSRSKNNTYKKNNNCKKKKKHKQEEEEAPAEKKTKTNVQRQEGEAGTAQKGALGLEASPGLAGPAAKGLHCRTRHRNYQHSPYLTLLYILAITTIMFVGSYYKSRTPTP